MASFSKTFDFNLRRDHQKNFLWASRLWVGRRKEPILGYVPKNEEKKNSGGEGLTLVKTEQLITKKHIHLNTLKKSSLIDQCLKQNFIAMNWSFSMVFRINRNNLIGYPQLTSYNPSKRIRRFWTILVDYRAWYVKNTLCLGDNWTSILNLKFTLLPQENFLPHEKTGYWGTPTSKTKKKNPKIKKKDH